MDIGAVHLSHRVRLDLRRAAGAALTINKPFRSRTTGTKFMHCRQNPQPQPFAGVGRGSHLHRCGGGKVFRWEHGRRREGLICLYESEIGLRNHIGRRCGAYVFTGEKSRDGTHTYIYTNPLFIFFVLERDFCCFIWKLIF